jgi:UDP-hydrolysing UDP-N-acetyl-D-glucosamine 2-epimerase
MAELRDNSGVELQVLCSGSALLHRYGRVVDLIRSDGFQIADELYTFVEGDELLNMALTTSGTISQTAAVLRNTKPDCVVTVADRYETLGTAVAAAYLGIPLVHIQGGEITGNIDEKVRHAVTKLADMHLVATQGAAKRVRRMGETASAVHITGCPSVDLAREASIMDRAVVQAALAEFGAGDRVNLEGDYIVVLQHPETEAHDGSYNQMEIVLEAVRMFGIPAIVFWPNVDAGSDGTSKAIRVFREAGKGASFQFVKNLEGRLFLTLLKGARCLIGNSSVGIRECAYIGTPVVNIGQRQSGRERANNVTDVAWDAASISAAIAKQLAIGRYKSSNLYGDGYAGQRIANLIASAEISTNKRFSQHG